MLKDPTIAALLCLLSFYCHSQNVTLQVRDTTGVSDTLKAKSKQLVEQKAQLEQAVSTARSDINLIDETAADLRNGSVDLEALEKKVYSEKHIRQIQDSISALTGVAIPTDIDRLRGLTKMREVSSEELLGILNEKFPQYPAPKANHLDDLQKLQKGENLDAIPELSAVMDVSKLQLSPEDILQMSATRGGLVNSKYLKTIDSIRLLTLQKAQLRLTEMQVSPASKITVIKQKPNFLQRSYIEGIVGILSGKDFTIYQASPALGYHFTDYLSAGLGPNIQLIGSDKKLYANAGFRTFAKMEFLQRQVYLQIEDALTPYNGKAEDFNLNSHNVYAGGGFLLSLKSQFTLNFNLMYQVNENRLQVSDLSPFVFRLGISSVKIAK